MSSKIQVQRICQFCGSEFIARTTVTKFCGDICAKRAYKERKRTEKLQRSDNEMRKIKTQRTEELNSREFLTVTQVSKLIGCSRQNIYKLINSGKLKATNILEKKTIVTRSDLNDLFSKKIKKRTPYYYTFEECYTLKDIKNKFGVSESLIQQIVKRNNIPKIRKGKFAFVPKRLIDDILK
ncbi:helix-turn-helix transcriptional regulator [Sunxiuqinia sp. sy24]|uniref:helix-turn-helix transcriptional regulator n=1 Tax=Sunxiuqinia sp. sy24 TaxID=3461495 RepID=UPI00404522E4